jgi:hypothetical protein
LIEGGGLMPVDPITQISVTSQEAANQALEEHLAEKKIIADEQADKAAKVLVAKEALEAREYKKIEDEKFQEAKSLKADQAEQYQVTKEADKDALEAKTLKADQAENYQIKKETNKQALEAKSAKMDAVTNADASHFHAAEVNSKAAQDKASATIEQNTVVLEDFLAAKTSTAEVNRRADNAAASDTANTNILNSKSETEQAVEAYHDNMAAQNTQQQTENATEAARLAGAATLTIGRDASPTPRINVMD